MHAKLSHAFCQLDDRKSTGQFEVKITKRTVSQPRRYQWLYYFMFRGLTVSLIMVVGRIGVIIGNQVLPVFTNLSCAFGFWAIGFMNLRESARFRLHSWNEAHCPNRFSCRSDYVGLLETTESVRRWGAEIGHENRLMVYFKHRLELVLGMILCTFQYNSRYHVFEDFRLILKRDDSAEKRIWNMFN